MSNNAVKVKNHKLYYCVHSFQHTNTRVLHNVYEEKMSPTNLVFTQLFWKIHG